MPDHPKLELLLGVLPEPPPTPPKVPVRNELGADYSMSFPDNATLEQGLRGVVGAILRENPEYPLVDGIDRRITPDGYGMHVLHTSAYMNSRDRSILRSRHEIQHYLANVVDRLTTELLSGMQAHYIDEISLVTTHAVGMDGALTEGWILGTMQQIREVRGRYGLRDLVPVVIDDREWRNPVIASNLGVCYVNDPTVTVMNEPVDMRTGIHISYPVRYEPGNSFRVLIVPES